MCKYKVAFVVVACVICMFTFNLAVAGECPGKEWSLGRAIEVIPTDNESLWKAKLGKCVNGRIVFSSPNHFNAQPTVAELNKVFHTVVHAKSWHEVPAKKRVYYVFEDDWQKWRRKIDGVRPAIISFLLTSSRSHPGPNALVYTPEHPNPKAKNEEVLVLSDGAWQRRAYRIGELYAQIQVRAAGGKMKIGQRIDADHVKFFDVRYDIPVDPSWCPGSAPFNLKELFPGYVFKHEFYPDDEDGRDVWSARVFIPGYKHMAWTPDNPNPQVGNEIILLSENSWQNELYLVGTTYCQVSLQSNDTFKLKFGKIYKGYVKIFNLYRDIPIPANWIRGDPPIKLQFAYPEYKFGAGNDPGGSKDVWTAKVWVQ